MKKIITLLLFFPLLSFAQVERFGTVSTKKVESYNGDLNINSQNNAINFQIGGVTKQTLNSSGYILNQLGAVGTPSYSFIGDIDTGMWSPGSNILAWSTAGSERMRITSGGNILAFGATQRSSVGGNGNYQVTPNLSVYATQGILLERSDNTIYGAPFTFYKSRLTAVCQSGDNMGAIQWAATDGSNDSNSSAEITVEADATHGASSTPGRLILKTTATSSKVPTERMRIDSSGNITIAGLTGTGTQGSSISSTGAITRASRPTVQRLITSGTYTTPANVTYLKIRAIGGGGGGGGGGQAGSTNGGNGTSTLFGTILTAPGGNGGLSGLNNGAAGAGGAAATINSPAIRITDISQAGNGGGSYISYSGGTTTVSTTFSGLTGGVSPFGGAGIGRFSNSGTAAAANSGSGGGSGGWGVNASGANNYQLGGSGGTGTYVEIIVPNPASSYSYTIGSGGSGGTGAPNNGTNTFDGGNGGSGIVIVEEYY